MKRPRKRNKPIMQKQIPTILGLLILVGALILGLVLFGEGTGVFAPRATAETTPKNIRVTNLGFDSFSVVFYTDDATAGFVKYGTEAGKLNTQVQDDRDQLSGTVEDYQLHHVTVRGLQPNTDYYFVLGTGSNAEFDQEGEPFTVTTLTKPTNNVTESITVFGSVALTSGAPAQGSVVFVTAPGMQDMSSLVKGSGSWAIPLSQALSSDNSGYANLDAQDQIAITVQGVNSAERVQANTVIAEAQPIELVFGQDGLTNNTATDSAQTATAGAQAQVAPTATPIATASADLAQVEETSDSTVSGHLKQLLDEAGPLPQESSASSEVLVGELQTDENAIVYTNSSPKIKGKVSASNVEVKIEVHSESQYEQTTTTDDEGNFEMDLESLKADLEPGEHTVTYSYTDPDTGQEVVKTDFFWVEDPDLVSVAEADTEADDDQAELLADNSTPNGTGNPYAAPTSSTSQTSTVTPTQSTTAPTSSYSRTTPTTQPTSTATSSSRQYTNSSDSSELEPGSIGVTTLLILAGVFFVLIGSWSWWLAGEIR